MNRILFIKPQDALFEKLNLLLPAMALGALFNPAPSDSARFTDCRSTLQSELDTKLQEVESLIEAGDHDSARDRLRQIDTRFGGMAALRSVELAAMLKQKD